MILETYASAREFLSATEAYRCSAPWTTNVMGSVATAVAEGQRHYDAYQWWSVREGDEVVLAAMRTSPLAVSCGPGPRAAAEILGQEVAELCDDTPGLNGPEDVVGWTLDAYRRSDSPGSRRATRIDLRSVLYVCTEVIAPHVEGRARRAVAGDVEIVLAWLTAFADETSVPHTDEATIRRKIADDEILLWEVAGATVSLAGHATPVATPQGVVTRVGPVYTPKNQRARGFAGAVTASLTQSLLSQGSQVMLYADASNATSNGLYQRLGYRAVGTTVSLSFTTGSSA